jgi:hypothetical protein
MILKRFCSFRRHWTHRLVFLPSPCSALPTSLIPLDDSNHVTLRCLITITSWTGVSARTGCVYTDNMSRPVSQYHMQRHASRDTTSTRWNSYVGPKQYREGNINIYPTETGLDKFLKTSGGLLWTWQWTFWFHKKRGASGHMSDYQLFKKECAAWL